MTTAAVPAPLVLREDRGPVRILTLNRPAALNALSARLIEQLRTALREADTDDAVRALVLTGANGHFAAGADIAEMAEQSFLDMFLEDYANSGWESTAAVRTPIIAAVAGYALGGGTELAMMCDMVFAAESAVFGLPETTLGIIPGAGGTQRLSRAVGKSVAMDMILTGRRITGREALAMGLAARVVADEALLDTAVEAATIIAGRSRPATLMAKEAVNHSFNSTLNEGIRVERRFFNALFATDGQKDGMAAFLARRSSSAR